MKKLTLIILISIFLALPVIVIPQIAVAQECPSEKINCLKCPADQPVGLVPCAKECDHLDTTTNECCPCTLCHFFIMFERIVDFIMFTLVPVVAILMIVVGGFMFLVGGGSGPEIIPGGQSGSPALLKRGRQVITSTIWGLIIVYSAWIIVNTFLVIIGVADWTGLATGWFTINCPVP